MTLTRSELLPKLEELQVFKYLAPDGRDQGVKPTLMATSVALDSLGLVLAICSAICSVMM